MSDVNSGCCSRICDNKRYFLAILACIGLILDLGMRCEIGLAIIKMTQFHKVKENIVSSTSNATIHKYIRVRDVAWSNTKVSLIEASFFIGYMLSSIPAGFVVSVWSPNILLGFAVLTSGAMNMLIPSLVRDGQSFVSVFIIRILQGMADGCLYPALHSFWRYWAPRPERSKLVTITFFGIALGPIIGYPVSGYITNKYDWQVNFYFWGSLVMGWSIIWLLISRKSPTNDRCISAAERQYIEANTASTTIIKPNQLPWTAIFTSVPVWAIVVANIGRNWTFQFSFSGLPAYFKHRFHETSMDIGLNMSIPFIVMGILTPIGGIWADCMIKRNYQVGRVRKLFNSIGFGISAVCFIILGFIPQLWLAILFLSVGLGASGLGMSGYGVNHLDIADIYAGVLMGISNGIGTMAGIISPIVAMSLTKNRNANNFSFTVGWQIFFMLSGTIQLMCVLFYATFASGETQSWSKSHRVSLDDTDAPKTKPNYESIDK